MSPRGALRQGVGRSAYERDRRPKLSKADRLDRLGARMDVLTRDVRLGSTSHRETERQIHEAEEIARELRAIFRAPTPPAEHPPLQQTADGAWW